MRDAIARRGTDSSRTAAAAPPPAGRTGRAALALLAVLGLCACARRAPDERLPDGRLVLDYWEKWTGFEGEAMDAVVADYNASQDRVFVRKLTVSQMEYKLMLATAGGNPPDVAGLWSHFVTDFAEKGALTPLSALAAEAGMSRADYIPVFWDLCLHRGFLWALPTTPSTTALHWNKKMFREAGLDPERPPRTLAELDAMAERLTIVAVARGGQTARVRFTDLTPAERERGDFAILQLGHVPQEPGWWMPMWGYWFGSSLWDGERQITAASPENVAAFEWMQSYARKYGVRNLRTFGASFGNFSSPQNPFLSSRVAMVIQGVWMYNFITKYAPHLEWGAAPFPSVDPERLPAVSVAECDVLVMPKGCRHPREAFAFMRYVNSRPALEKLNLGQRKFSPLAEATPGFYAAHPNPCIDVFVELARSPQARTVPRISFWLEYGDEMRDAIDQTLALARPPADALRDVQARVQWKCDRVLRRWDRVGAQRTAEWRAYDAP